MLGAAEVPLEAMGFHAARPPYNQLTVGVAGRRTMGRGFMQVAGYASVAMTKSPSRNRKRIPLRHVVRSVGKGLIKTDEAKAAIKRFIVTKLLAEIAAAKLIVAAIIKRLDLEQRLFVELHEMIGPRAQST
jgi:3-hydroxyacyl-CoA dehydrogenase